MKAAGAGLELGVEGNPEVLVLPPHVFVSLPPSLQQPYCLEIRVSGEGWIVRGGGLMGDCLGRVQSGPAD